MEAAWSNSNSNSTSNNNDNNNNNNNNNNKVRAPPTVRVYFLRNSNPREWAGHQSQASTTFRPLAIIVAKAPATAVCGI